MPPGAPATADLVLAGEFPAPDHDQWAAAVATALDRTGELTPEAALARLRTTTYDGITIEPLYTAADAAAAGCRRLPGPRTVRPGRTRDGHPRTTAGTSASASTPPRAPTAPSPSWRGAPRPCSSTSPASATIDADAVAGVLDGVLLDLAGVVLDAGARWREAADAVGDRLQSGSLGADPLGIAAADPSAIDAAAHLDAIAAWITTLGADRPGLRVVTIDGTRFHDAGASDAQQLGATIAAGIEYLRALDARGIAPADAIARIELRLAATADQFATIATFRAVRRLWARVADAGRRRRRHVADPRRRRRGR